MRQREQNICLAGGDESIFIFRVCDAIATKYNKILYHRKLIDFPKWYLGLLAAMNEKYNFFSSSRSGFSYCYTLLG